MSRICEVTGKAGLVGNMVSHSNRKKLMKQLPNLQKKRFYIPESRRRSLGNPPRERCRSAHHQQARHPGRRPGTRNLIPVSERNLTAKAALGGVLCILVSRSQFLVSISKTAPTASFLSTNGQ